MPVHVLSEGAGPGAQVPKHLSCVSIALISTRTNCSDKTVKGKVLRKCPLVSSASGDFILKIIVQEEVSPPDASPQNPPINVILFGAIAKDFDGAVNQGDVVAAAGFTVGKSPTVQKDKLHPFNLLLRGDGACIYVSPPLPPPPLPPPVSRSSPAAKRSSSLSAEVSRKTKVPKYTYVGLGDLTAGSVVNVYGVVVFFKQPFKTRGTDLCSSLKITDQSNEKISCSIFCEKLEDHPKVYQIGDIVRLHRVKVQLFNGSMTLVKTFGFSVMAFDGAVGGATEPRTSSRSFSFDQEDRRRVEELRSWASDPSLLPPSPTMPLCDVRPKAYFDLTCQLLAKAPVDSTCTLLRVWDGTRSAYTLLKVIVEPDATEGPSSFPPERERLIANILVYDNHVEYARQLKPGEFLRIYNLRAIPGSSKVPGLTSSQEELDHLAFHLHGGNTFGRGIRLLPEDCPDVQEMKRVMEACPEDDEDEFSDLNDSELMEIWSTPPESIEPSLLRAQMSESARREDAETPESINTGCSSSTERRCDHDTHSVSLSEVKRSGPAGVHHVRVQLRSYEPQRLHQSLKLYCSKCSTLQEVPDDEMLAGLFSEASRDSGPFSPPAWAVSGQVDVPGNPPGAKTRTLGVHLSTVFMSKQLLFLMGSSLEETFVLSSGYQNIVPVRSSGGQLTLLHPSAPFLFRGTRTYYGCERCSEAAVREPVCAGEGKILDEKIIAEALGVVPLHFVLLMKLELQDVSDSLHVFLWRNAEEFFGVSAEDAAANQEAQDIISQSMDSLCPAGGSTAERPWMDLCLTKYQSVEDDGQNQICYQISHSTFTRPPAPPSANPA